MISSLDGNNATLSSDFLGVNHVTPKKKYRKKPDPRAPEITEPCSECGKRFWSWKALFGHMRCHPERQWRGINPPSNLKKRQSSTTMAASGGGSCHHSKMTEEDREVASCLLMLANSKFHGSYDNNNNSSDYYYFYHHNSTPSVTTSRDEATVISHGTTMLESTTSDVVGVIKENDTEVAGITLEGRFECSSCKKVFGSHQALGGHRASHKNVKGCFAITRSSGDGGGEEEEEELFSGGVGGEENTSNCKLLIGFSGHQHHQCNICSKVFSSGQALGGHKRCHWEKLDEPIFSSSGGLNYICSAYDDEGNLGIDLNLPAAAATTEGDSLPLDLRLGL